MIFQLSFFGLENQSAAPQSQGVIFLLVEESCQVGVGSIDKACNGETLKGFKLIF